VGVKPRLVFARAFDLVKRVEAVRLPLFEGTFAVYECDVLYRLRWSQGIPNASWGACSSVFNGYRLPLCEVAGWAWQRRDNATADCATLRSHIIHTRRSPPAQQSGI